MPPPWYQIPPLDFITETLLPWEIRDERVLDFELIPQQTVDPNQVVERGQNLRDQARQGTGIPLLGPQSQGVSPASANVPLPAAR